MPVQDENSVQKSGKLLPFLKAKADFHQSRIAAFDEKIAERKDNISLCEAKIERLSAKADRLADKNTMLKTTVGDLGIVRRMIERNEQRIEAIRSQKIPKIETKIERHRQRLGELTAKRDAIGHKLERVIAMNDAIKSFFISFNKERRAVFADAMDRLNAANSACLTDKLNALTERRNQLTEQYYAPQTSEVDRVKLSAKIRSVNQDIADLEDRIHKLARPPHHFAEQTDVMIDATMKVTADAIAAQGYDMGMTEFTESIFVAANGIDALEQTEIRLLADSFNPLENAETALEDDANMIDGIINNGSKEDLLKSQKELTETLDAMKEIAGNRYMMESVRESVAADIPKIEAQLRAITAALQKMDSLEAVNDAAFMDAEIAEVETWLSGMVADRKAEVREDGSFKVNPEYYQSLDRGERHIEALTEEQALTVMPMLAKSGIDFSAASRGDDKVGITVAKKDMVALNDIMHAAIGKTVARLGDKVPKQDDVHYETVNPDYYASLPQETRSTSVETRDAADKIMSKLDAEKIPYSAVFRKNDTVAITVSQRNADSYRQISNNVKNDRAAKMVNPDFYKALPKEFRVTQRMNEGQAQAKVAELSAKGIAHSAVLNGEKSAVTVAKKDAKRAFFTRSQLKKETQRIGSEKKNRGSRRKKEVRDLNEAAR